MQMINGKLIGSESDDYQHITYQIERLLEERKKSLVLAKELSGQLQAIQISLSIIECRLNSWQNAKSNQNKTNGKKLEEPISKLLFFLAVTSLVSFIVFSIGVAWKSSSPAHPQKKAQSIELFSRLK